MRMSKLNVKQEVEDIIQTKTKVRLENLLKSHFQFKLDDDFKRKFLEEIYMGKGDKTWIEFAKELDVNERHLRRFLLNNCYNSGKVMLFTSGMLSKFLKIGKYKLPNIEKHVVAVRTGENGRKENIKLPLLTSIIGANPKSIKRDLVEYVFRNKIEKVLDGESKATLPMFFTKNNGYTSLNVLKFLEDNYIERLHLRQAKIKKVNYKKIKISYINTYDGRIKEIVLPKKIILDETFFREFGKWIGDRSGQAGLSGKDISILSEFCEFLKSKLYQPKKDITGRVLYKGFLNKKYHFDNLINYIKVGKTRYDKNEVVKDFVYEIYGSKLIRKLIFDPIELHLNQLLFNSKKSCRYAFYSGLFEAEGYLDPTKKIVEFNFGASTANLNRIINTWIQALQLSYWLKKDDFDPESGRHISGESVSYKTRLYANGNKIRNLIIFDKCVKPYLLKSTQKFATLDSLNKREVMIHT